MPYRRLDKSKTCHVRKDSSYVTSNQITVSAAKLASKVLYNSLEEKNRHSAYNLFMLCLSCLEFFVVTMASQHLGQDIHNPLANINFCFCFAAVLIKAEELMWDIEDLIKQFESNGGSRQKQKHSKV